MITVKRMKELEQIAVKRGISESQLMHNAGRAVFETIAEKYDLDHHVIIFAGSGNNGGDGFVTARYLSEHCPVIVLFFGEKDSLSEESLENYEKIRKRINVIPIKSKSDMGSFQVQEGIDLILIDALLGTGIKGVVREPVSFGIDYFNTLRGIKIAVDVPSGIDADTGEVYERSCHVDLIICFHDIKKGLEKFRDRTAIVDIGIPKV